MAEAILKDKLSKLGAQLVSVSSAGTGTVDGAPASFLGITILRTHGIDLIGHRSTPLSRRQMERADLVIAMAKNHYDKMLNDYPDRADKIFLLRTFMKDEEVEDDSVEDPIGGDMEAYERVYQVLDAELDRIVNHIINLSMEK